MTVLHPFLRQPKQVVWLSLIITLVSLVIDFALREELLGEILSERVFLPHLLLKVLGICF